MFNPEVSGNPVLINRECSVLLDKCGRGITLKEFLPICPPKLTKQERTAVFAFLKDYCFTKKTAFNKFSSGDFGVWFHVTNNCNLSCPYCFVNKTRESISKPKINIVVRSLIKAAVERKSKSLKMKFSGGEPLLRCDLIKHAIEVAEHEAKGKLLIDYTVLTNGTII
ncbi:MAG: 4Fe-4S cluster-binding domain-containing protein, partial [Deltaproteobacteria bacterium]|nr:4Fe-4S cluster-binding domain-containing protein [Deltaproteobacteria bacterium]